MKDSKDNKREEGKDLFLRMSGDQSEEMSDVAEISYFSNISDVFKRDDVLQDKMKRGKNFTRRVHSSLHKNISLYQVS